MKLLEKEIREIAHRLDAVYAAGGKAALEQMRVGEVQLLLSEKFMDLNAVCQKLGKHPQDEVGLLRKAKLEREACEIAGYTKERDHGRDR